MIRSGAMVLGVGVLAVLLATNGARMLAAQQPPGGTVVSSAANASSAQLALIRTYCVGCHNERLKTNFGGLALDSADIAEVGAHPELWEKVIRKINAGQMPPSGRPRPDAARMNALVAWLESELDRAAAARPNPGRTEAFHRLNRAEYRNAIRDLLGLDVDVAPLLPIDDASYGFDNIAGVLKISQPQLEQYLAVARVIARQAVGAPLSAPTAQEFRAPDTLSQYEHIDGLPFGTRGGMAIAYDFPLNGEYEISVDLLCRLHGECDGSVQFGDLHQLEIAIDGVRLGLFDLEPRKLLRPPQERRLRVRVPVTAGPHSVTAAFLKLPSIREADSQIERFLKPHYDTGTAAELSQVIYQPFIDRVTIGGPVGGGSAGDTPSRRAILICQPSTPADEIPCARKILTRLARLGYRRPVTSADVDPLLQFYREGRADSTFENGIEVALRRLLVSLNFLFRIERDAGGAAPGAPYEVSDLELASRLSFFLWSSIPDDELLTVAGTGKLRTPAVLKQQVQRMLDDPRATALMKNFAGQWLQLRNLDAVRMDFSLFPNFDDGLRLGFRRETELFVESILRENRSAIDMLTADYTFVNERLARHYGIPNVYGDRFRRVTVADPHRRGLLGHGSVLTVTSRPNRTSPVLRGKWILNNILGTPPPDPPADVPALQENELGNHDKVLTVRERLAAHRVNAVCAGCHAMIDPPGFALENFDAVGRWRTRDESRAPIDASGVLPDGTRFDGVDGFRQALLRNQAQFVTTVTEKLLTYALGRGLEDYDMPAVRRIVRAAAPDYKLSAIVLGVAESIPFRMRRASAAPAVAYHEVVQPPMAVRFSPAAPVHRTVASRSRSLQW